MTLDQRVRELRVEHAKILGVLQVYGSVLTRGFWGRMKWLLVGR